MSDYNKESMKRYTISIDELLKRPIIRNDFEEWEWMNKMTDEELSKMDEEIYAGLDSEGIHGLSDRNSAHLAALIDFGIWYKLFKMQDK